MKITLQGKPISVNDLYRGRRFLTKEGTLAKRSYSLQARSQYHENIITEPVKVSLHVFFPNPKMSDLDNALKGTLDSLTGVLWKDDRQIQELHVFKHEDKSNPRVELDVTHG